MRVFILSLAAIGMVAANDVAWAAPRPALIEPRSAEAPSRPANCAVTLTKIEDLRRDARAAGSIGIRPVQAPADARSWLLTVLARLVERGVSLHEDAPPAAESAAPSEGVLPAANAPPPELPEMQVTLISAWGASVTTSSTVTVVIRVKAGMMGGEPLERDYRGNVVRINWSSGEGEISRLFDAAWDDALDKLALDLKASFCPASG